MVTKTSFGELQILLKEGAKPRVEHLKFQTSGLPHKHHEFEFFFTLKGTGTVYLDQRKISVSPGTLVEIPPQQSHWMEPDPGQTLEGLLWYHDGPVEKI